MAVRGTELRLAIIVSNQASFAIGRIGSDLRRLQAQTAQFDRNQIRTLGQLAQQKEKVARLGSKAAQAELSTSAGINRNLASQARLSEKLYNMGVRGAALQSMMNKQYQTANLTESQRLVVQLQALKLDAQRLAVIEGQNAALRVQIAEETALAQRIATVGMAEAARLDAMERRASQLQSRQVTGRAISHVGRAASFGGLIAGAALTGTASAFADFDRQATLAATQTRNAGEDFLTTARNAGVLRDEILKMTRSFPAAASEMADSAYQIYSSTQATFPGGIKLLREFNKAAVAGGVSLEEATSIGIRVLNNFDEKFRQTGAVTDKTFEILNRMFSIVRYGAINFSEFGQIMEQVAPAAANAGSSLDDVAGAIAILTRRMGAAKTGAGLARLIEIFQRDEFKRGMKELKADITDATGALLPFTEIMARLSAVSEGLPKGTNIIKMITALGDPGTKGLEGTIQARRALSFLLDDMQTFSDLQDLTVANQNEFNQAFQAMSRTPGVRWAVMVNQLKALVLVIGESAIPVIARMIDKVVVLIHWWEDLSEHTRDTIVKWGVLISVGALLGGLILSLVGSLISLSAELAGLSTSLGGPRGVNTTLNTFLTAMRSLAAIGVIVVGVELMQMGGNWASLGRVITAAGIGGLFKGARGAGVAGVIAIGVELIMQGGGWSSKIGSILLAGGAGFAFGGAPGAVIASALATVTIVIKDEKAKNELIDLLRDLEKRADEVTSTVAAASNVSAEEARKTLTSAFKSINPDLSSAQGVKNAIAFLNSYEKTLRRGAGVARDAFEGLIPDQKTILDNNKQTVAEMIKQIGAGTKLQTILERMAEETGEVADEADRLALNLIKAAKTGNFSSMLGQLKKFAADASAELSPAQILKQIEAAAKKGNVEEVGRLMNEYATAVERASDDAAKAAEDSADRIVRKNEAVAKSVEDMQSQIETAGQRLADMYQELENQNRSAFGTLFQGPVMKGPIGQIFDELREFNIPPPIKLLTQDLQAQTENFQKMQDNVALLRKRGAPPALLDQIRAMGEEGKLFLQSLAQASPGAFKKFLAAFNQAQTEIDKATKLDMNNKLAAWEKQGKDMMQALILGVKRESDKLDQFFINYINKKFPNLLKQAAKDAGVKFETDNPPKKRQHGGSVQPGVPYRIGEFGPETMTFDGPGKITPSTRTTGSVEKKEIHYHDNTTINADGASTEAVMRALNKKNFRMKNRYQTP